MKGTTKRCYILKIKTLGRVVLEKKIFSPFSHYKPMADNDALGRGQFGPQGHDWQELLRGLLNIASHKI